MLSIILCSHAGMAEGLKSSAQMICGEVENIESISFSEGDSPEELISRIKSVYEHFVEQGCKVAVLTDLFGATPFNCCVQALAGTETIIISGMSLPILLELMVNREQMEDYKTYVMGCVDAAAGSIRAVDMEEF